MTTCPHCTNAAAVARLEEEVSQLYAALRSATKDNLEMRKRLQAWADDFLPGEPAPTGRVVRRPVGSQ
jgi:hypothetical protein